MVKSRDSMTGDLAGICLTTAVNQLRINEPWAHTFAGVAQGLCHVLAKKSTTHVAIANVGLVSQIAISTIGIRPQIESSSSRCAGSTGAATPDGGCS